MPASPSLLLLNSRRYIPENDPFTMGTSAIYSEANRDAEAHAMRKEDFLHAEEALK